MVSDLVATAGRAPSLHNSQPWRFRLDGAALELRVDPQRALVVADPSARELVLSCGAALYNLRLALRNKGLVPHVDVSPRSSDPLLLARITAEPGAAPTPDERRLLAAVVHRHTHRLGFTSTPLAETLTDSLEADVATEGARLVWLDGAERVSAVSKLALLADVLQVGDPEWRAEVARWVNTGRHDGIPLAAIGSGPGSGTAPDRLPAREFRPGRALGSSEQSSGAAGRIAVLATAGDRVVDWLAAGQGLQRMLLRAAGDWVFATYATAVLELPILRDALRERMGLRDYPQMLLELGHAGSAHSTPRLSVEEQLESPVG